MNLSIIIMILGSIIMLTGAFFLLPMITGLLYGEFHIALIYLCLAGACAVCGFPYPFLPWQRKNVKKRAFFPYELIRTPKTQKCSTPFPRRAFSGRAR